MLVFKKIEKDFLEANVTQFLKLIKGWKYSVWNEDNFFYELPSKWQFSFGAWSEENLIGFCFASNKIKDSYYIHLIYLSTESRGKSLGKKMIDHAIKIAKENHIHKIELRCPETNIGSLEFYKKQGFKVAEVLKDETSGDEADYYLRLDFLTWKNSYIIAEIGNNHNGSLAKALELIDASYNTGVDAVKFQTFRGIDIVSPNVKASEYKGWDVKNFEFWYQFLDSIALKTGRPPAGYRLY